MGGITKVAGLFFGAWVVVMGCGGHEADATCVPGQSIACVGAGGCASSQVCSADGTRYEACVCGSSTTSNDDGGLPDGYAPLPPPVGDQGYNAIWIESAPSSTPRSIALGRPPAWET